MSHKPKGGGGGGGGQGGDIVFAADFMHYLSNRLMDFDQLAYRHCWEGDVL